MGTSHSRESKAPVTSRFSVPENHLLRATYKELASMSKSHKTIDKATFLRFVPLPGMYGERLFKVFDDKHTGYIDFEEFLTGLSVWCKGTSREKVEFIFRLYDLNCDNSVSRAELQTMLMNIPPYALRILGSHLEPQIIARIVEAGLAANHEGQLNAPGGMSVESSSVLQRDVSHGIPIPTNNQNVGLVGDLETLNPHSCESSTVAAELEVTNVGPQSNHSNGGEPIPKPCGKEEIRDCNFNVGRNTEIPAQKVEDLRVVNSGNIALSSLSSMDHECNESEWTDPNSHSHLHDLQLGGEHLSVPSSVPESSQSLASDTTVPQPRSRGVTNSLPEVAEYGQAPLDETEGPMHHVGVEFSLDMLDEADWTDSMSRLVVEELVKMAFRGQELGPEACLTLDQFVDWIELMPEMVEFMESMFPTIYSGNPPGSKHSPGQVMQQKSIDGDSNVEKTPKSGKLGVAPRLSRSFSASSHLSQRLSSVYSTVRSRHGSTTSPAGTAARPCPCHISRSAAAVAASQSQSCTFGTCKKMTKQSKHIPQHLRSAPGSQYGIPHSHSMSHISQHKHTSETGSTFSPSTSLEGVRATSLRRSNSEALPCDTPTGGMLQHALRFAPHTASPGDDIRTTVPEPVNISQPASNTSESSLPAEVEDCDEENDLDEVACSGVLYKKGKRSHVLLARWCVLGKQDQFLFYYHKAKDREPAGVIYLEGSFVEPVGSMSTTTTTSSRAAISLSRSRTTSPPPLFSPQPNKDLESPVMLKRSQTVPSKHPGASSSDGAKQGSTSPVRNPSKRGKSLDHSSTSHHSIHIPHVPLHVPHALQRATFGIRITPSGNGESRILYAQTAEDRNRWLHALKRATKVRDISNHYELGEQIGSGRFSKVYMCRSLDDDDGESVHSGGAAGRTAMDEYRYAVKVIDKTQIRESEKELLRNEIAILRLVNQPNVVRTLDVFESLKHIYIVMDRIIGGELYHRVVGRRCLTELEAFKVIKGLVTGIHYLHSLGIVHRDIKPENILCGTDLSDIKIADFGLSQLAGPQEVLLLPCGTLSYVAPEVLITGRKAAEAEAQQHHLALSAPLGSNSNNHAAAIAAAEQALRQSIMPPNSALGASHNARASSGDHSVRRGNAFGDGDADSKKDKMGYGKEADLWSVGVILYLLVAGRLPFNGRTRSDTIDLICGLELRFDVPPFGRMSQELRKLLSELLCKDPKSRLGAAAVLQHPWILKMEQIAHAAEAAAAT